MRVTICLVNNKKSIDLNLGKANQLKREADKNQIRKKSSKEIERLKRDEEREKEVLTDRAH